MSILIQKTYTIETKNGRIVTAGNFPSCEIASRLSPLQKEMIAEHAIHKYLLFMEQEIRTEQDNDWAQDELKHIADILRHGGVHIQLVEKI